MSHVVLQAENFGIRDVQSGREELRIEDLSLSLYEGDAQGILLCDAPETRKFLAQVLAARHIDGLQYSGTLQFMGKELHQYGRRDVLPFSLLRGGFFHSLNTYQKIGYQLKEKVRRYRKMRSQTAWLKVKDTLRHVGVINIDSCLGSYPYQLSSENLARIMIAVELLSRPVVLVVNDLWTQLNTTMREELCQLLQAKREDYGMSLLFLSEDIEFLLAMSDKVSIMYEGKMVEVAAPRQIRQQPQHPFTRHLLELSRSLEQGELPSLPERKLAS